MWLRSLLINLAVLGFALSEQLPSGAYQTERKRIEIKTKGETPELKGGESINIEKSQKVQKKVRYEIKDEIRTPKFEVSRGESLEKEKQAENVERREGRSEAKEEKKEVVERAVCVVESPVAVSLEPVYQSVECLRTSGAEKRIVKAEMVFLPDPAQFKLTARVLEFDGRKVKRSVVLTSGQTRSENVADEVDRQLIANILLKAGYKTGEQVSKSVEDILRQGGTTVVSGQSVVVSKDVERELQQVPKSALYMGMANLLSSSTEVLMRDKKGLPPIFKVRAGKELLVEVETE